MSARFRKVASEQTLEELLNLAVQPHESVVHVEGVVFHTEPPTYGWAVFVDTRPPAPQPPAPEAGPE